MVGKIKERASVQTFWLDKPLRWSSAKAELKLRQKATFTYIHLLYWHKSHLVKTRITLTQKKNKAILSQLNVEKNRLGCVLKSLKFNDE